MSIWHVLKIEETTDTSKIKRAYAKMSKLCHPESEPEKFQELYQAYHRALDYAKENENIEEDFWDDEIIPAENVDFNEINAIEEPAQYPQTKEPETEQNPLFTNSLYANISERVAEGMTAFTEFFMASGRKDWKKFVVQPEFLRVQFDEMFVKLLADFLKQQTKYPVQELPYDLVKELYFCYYPYMEERGEAIFEDSFQELFDILYQNVRIDIVIDRHKSPKAWNEVVKYRVYYKLYASVAATGAQQELGLWDGYIPELARRFYVKDGVRTEIDPYNFKLLTFLIEDSPVFPEEIYHYLINKLKLIRAQATSRWELVAPLYRAIESKGISIEAQEKAQGTRKAEIRMLLEEVKKMFSKELESDRPAVQAFFRSDIYDKYKLDEEFFAFKLGPVVRDKHLISKIFLEEYLAYYNEVYAQTNSLVGKKMYTTISSRLKSQRVIGEHYEEIKEDKKEWVLRYFFEEGFTRVWGSHKSTMKIVYKNILKNHLETLAEQRNYEWDLYTDGHLYAIKSENNYVFVYDKVEEKAVLSMDEYYHLLEEMLDVYLNQYFCTTSEKANWNEQKEKAGMSCGNNRN